MSYLLHVHIGPVQAFIASARRTRDLWFGSWLLNELATTAARTISDAQGMLIFPAFDSSSTAGDSLPNAPNKIIAMIDQDSHTLGMAVHAALFKRLHTIRDGAFAAAQSKGGTFDREQAIRQIDDLLEYYWVAVPYDEPGTSYHKAREQVEVLMAARKNTRNFQPVTWGSNQPKSSITGELEAVTGNGQCGAKRGEYLSGVDLLKRHGNRGAEARFVSTSHMAALPFMQRFTDVKDDTLRQRWQDYQQALPDDIGERVPQPFRHPFFDDNDGALLFEDRLLEDIPDDNKRRQAQDKLRRFLQRASQVLAIGQPAPYYAIIHADGDSMGKVIDHLAKQPKGLERHRQLSQALDAFVAQARRIVQDQHGAAVYIGGDDVLALLPLHTVLDCANALATAFADQLKPFMVTDKQGRTVQPTLSVGIAVVHHLLPLTDALEIARRAEKLAKGVPGKNALAVITSRRSGGEYVVRGPRTDLYEQLNRLIALHHQQALPHGVAYELRDLALRLRLPTDQDEALKGQLLEARRHEVKRILKRKQTRSGAAIDEGTIGQLLKRLDALVKEQSGDPLELLAHELIIARECAAAMHMAGVSAQGGQPHGTN